MAELKDHQQRRRRQAGISPTPEVDGTGSGSLLDPILSTLSKKNNPVMSG